MSQAESADDLNPFEAKRRKGDSIVDQPVAVDTPDFGIYDYDSTRVRYFSLGMVTAQEAVTLSVSQLKQISSFREPFIRAVNSICSTEPSSSPIPEPKPTDGATVNHYFI